MRFFRNTVLLGAILVLTYFTARFFGKVYYSFISYEGGFFSLNRDAAEFLGGFSLAYIFFVIILFTIFGNQKKYRWIGILLIPAALFELYFDLSHIYLPIIIGLIGWLLGLGINKLIYRNKNQTSIKDT